MGLSIEINEGPGIRVLTVSGPLTYPEGTEALRSMMRARIAAGDRDFVLDLLAVPYIDSAGIGEVVAAYKRARERGGMVRLAMHSQSHLAFTYCHLDKMFDIDETPQAARQRFGDAERAG